MCYSSESDGKNTQTGQPVNLIISNLDPTIGTNELRKLLTNMFKEYAMVSASRNRRFWSISSSNILQILSLNVIVPTDGIPIANIKLSSQQEAQFAISQLHRHKLGQRRIVISYSQNNSPDPEQLRAMVIRLLQVRMKKILNSFIPIGVTERDTYRFSGSTRQRHAPLQALRAPRISLSLRRVRVGGEQVEGHLQDN